MRIPIKKYTMDESASWEERYRQLEAHHQKETEWMIGEIRFLEQLSGEDGTPWDQTRYAYSFDVRLQDGGVARALAWLDRNGNVRAQVENSEYVGPSWSQVRRLIQNDPKRVR